MKQINVEGIILTQLKNGATKAQAIEAAAAVMKTQSGARKSFRTQNEFIENCLSCAISKYSNLYPGTESIGRSQELFMLVALGWKPHEERGLA